MLNVVEWLRMPLVGAGRASSTLPVLARKTVSGLSMLTRPVSVVAKLMVGGSLI
jgi:hypothetical protein